MAVSKSFYARIVLTLLSFSSVLLFGVAIAQANSCHTITNSSQTPSGYASPESFFSGDLMINGSCNGSSINVEVGNGSQNTYVYSTSYHWNGSQWQTVTLSGSGQEGPWIPKSAGGQYTTSQGASWYVAYTCEWINGAWKCGCTTQSCTQNGWQVQAFQTTAQGGGTSVLPEMMQDNTPIPPFQHPTRDSSFKNLPQDTLLGISEYTPLNNLGVQPKHINNQSDKLKKAKASNSRWKDNATLKSLGLEYPVYIKRRGGNTRKLALSYGHPNNVVGSLYEQTYYDSTDYDQRWPKKRWAFSANVRGVDAGASKFLKELLERSFEHKKGKNIKTRLLPYELKSLLPGQKVTVEKDTKLKSLGIQPEGSAGNDNLTVGDMGGESFTIEINTDGVTEVAGEAARTFGEFTDYVTDNFNPEAFNLGKFDSITTDGMSWDQAGEDVVKAVNDMYAKATVGAAGLIGEAEEWAESATGSLGQTLTAMVAEVQAVFNENGPTFVDAVVEAFDFGDKSQQESYYGGDWGTEGENSGAGDYTGNSDFGSFGFGDNAVGSTETSGSFDGY